MNTGHAIGRKDIHGGNRKCSDFSATLSLPPDGLAAYQRVRGLHSG